MTDEQHPRYLADLLTQKRQRARNDFVKVLYEVHADSKDSIRQQVETMFDQWWPGTVAGERERDGREG